jgi:hypothetical protein
MFYLVSNLNFWTKIILVVIFISNSSFGFSQRSIYVIGNQYYNFPGYHIPSIGYGNSKGRNTYYASLMYTLPGPMLKPMVWSKLGLAINYVYRNEALNKKLQPLVQLQFDASYYHTQSPRIFWHQSDFIYFPFSRLNAHIMAGFGANKYLFNNIFIQATANMGALIDYKWFFNSSYLRGPLRSTSVNLLKVELFYVLDFEKKKVIKRLNF